MRRLSAVVACAAVLAVGNLGAQVRFGVQGDWGSEDRALGVGGRVVFGLRTLIPTPGWEGVASFDYFFPDEGPGQSITYWEINGNLIYVIPNVRGNLAPYAGGGLNIARASTEVGGQESSKTKAGINFLGGVKFKSRTSRLTPFAEVRAELGGGEIVVISGGVVF